MQLSSPKQGRQGSRHLSGTKINRKQTTTYPDPARPKPDPPRPKPDPGPTRPDPRPTQPDPCPTRPDPSPTWHRASSSKKNAYHHAR